MGTAFGTVVAAPKAPGDAGVPTVFAPSAGAAVGADG